MYPSTFWLVTIGLAGSRDLTPTVLKQIVAHYRVIEPDALVSRSLSLRHEVTRMRAEREACDGDGLGPQLVLECQHLGQHHGPSLV
jgi:hypothetical protein